MKKSLLVFALLFLAFTKNNAQTTCVQPGSYAECLIVKDDNNLTKDKVGNLMIGILAKDYSVAPNFQPHTLDIIVKAGDRIEFFAKDASAYGSTDYPVAGTLQSCTIRNKNGAGLLVLGRWEPVVFPYGTKITFSCIADMKYNFVRISEAILGADCEIPNIGKLKKGTKVTFSCNEPDGYSRGTYSVN